MKKFRWGLVIAGVFAYLGQKFLFSLFDFNYSIFNDGFDITKLLIDLGVWIALFVPAAYVIHRLDPNLFGGD